MEWAIAEVGRVGLAQASVLAPPTGNSAPAAGFENWLKTEVQALDSQLASSEAAVKELALGNAGNLHDVMLKMEQARLSLQLAMQVRNRVVEAYQEVLRMQV